MKVMIIDDEPLARSVVREYLGNFPEVQVIAECDDGFQGIKAITLEKPDLLFLDIQMPKLNGFEMLELLDQPPAVIFTTAFDEYAIKAFEKRAIDYLLKPFSRERFDQAMDNFKSRQGMISDLDSSGPIITDSQRVVVKTGSNIRIIPFHEIQYLEAADDFVKIHTAAGVFLKNRTMSWFEKALPMEEFVRVHRSYTVRVSQISRIDPYEKDGHVAQLPGGVSIPISRAGYARLRQVLGW